MFLHAGCGLVLAPPATTQMALCSLYLFLFSLALTRSLSRSIPSRSPALSLSRSLALAPWAACCLRAQVPKHTSRLALNAAGGAAVRRAPVILWDRARGGGRGEAEATQRWALAASGHLTSLAPGGLVVGLVTRPRRGHRRTADGRVERGCGSYRLFAFNGSHSELRKCVPLMKARNMMPSASLPLSLSGPLQIHGARGGRHGAHAGAALGPDGAALALVVWRGGELRGGGGAGPGARGGRLVRGQGAEWGTGVGGEVGGSGAGWGSRRASVTPSRCR